MNKEQDKENQNDFLMFNKIKQLKEEILSIKEHYLKDLIECSTKPPITHWIWVEATIRRLRKEIEELKEQLKNQLKIKKCH